MITGKYKLTTVSVLSFFLALSPIKSHASPIVTTIDLSGNLAYVDITAGQVLDMVGNIGFGFKDIAYDPSNQLYGITLTDLYKIDIATAQTTLIGAHGVTDASGLTFNDDGKLYASSATQSLLYELDPTTASKQIFADAGFSSLGDLAIVNDAIYLPTPTYQLLQLSISNPSQQTLLEYIPPLYGLISADDGWLYGFYRDQAFQIDPNTGQNTLYSSWTNQGLEQIVGAAIINESSAIAVSHTLSLFILGMLIMGFLKIILPILKSPREFWVTT